MGGFGVWFCFVYREISRAITFALHVCLLFSLYRDISRDKSRTRFLMSTVVFISRHLARKISNPFLYLFTFFLVPFLLYIHPRVYIFPERPRPSQRCNAPRGAATRRATARCHTFTLSGPLSAVLLRRSGTMSSATLKREHKIRIWSLENPAASKAPRVMSASTIRRFVQAIHCSHSTFSGKTFSLCAVVFWSFTAFLFNQYSRKRWPRRLGRYFSHVVELHEPSGRVLRPQQPHRRRLGAGMAPETCAARASEPAARKNKNMINRDL